MKVMTVLGTRPEIIRLCLIIKQLDQRTDHVLVHTGQNYDESLNDIFFQQLGLRSPDHALGIKASSFGEQIGQIIARTESLIREEKPDRLLILGDTNSGLAAVTAKRMGVPVYHMEAGNRCYDDRVPEEVNRRIIDHSSDVLMPYTYRSKENLVREGIARENIFVIGNPIFEVLQHYSQEIENSKVFEQVGCRKKNYFLVTMHRAENVDIESRLRNLVKALEMIAEKYKMPVICSLHPRTKNKMEMFGLSFDHEYIKYVTPLGLFDFVALEKNAFCVLSDSGTVQEECCIYHVPNVTIRDVTERPETVECGSNILTGDDPKTILNVVDLVVSRQPDWLVPDEYVAPNVTD
ncbi:MAG: UDP-N-acetylglucosamine 2-epimerase (non-hydrolyzing), partial [Chlorobiales bacterium]|nr:UDP-N-acetylglucosamine 2-epimerase (non-hydrolyzing) [Chlorobiales bacterium]